MIPFVEQSSPSNSVSPKSLNVQYVTEIHQTDTRCDLPPRCEIPSRCDIPPLQQVSTDIDFEEKSIAEDNMESLPDSFHPKPTGFTLPPVSNEQVFDSQQVTFDSVSSQASPVSTNSERSLN